MRRVIEHMLATAVGGVFTGRPADIQRRTNVPAKSIENIVATLLSDGQIQRIRSGTMHYAPQYWVDMTRPPPPVPVRVIKAPKPVAAKSAPKKKGNPCRLDPNQLARAEYLYCHTASPLAEIAGLIKANVTSSYLSWLARRRGWSRYVGAMVRPTQESVEQRLLTASLVRETEPRRPVDRVRKVAPGTFKVERFSMLGGSVR